MEFEEGTAVRFKIRGAAHRGTVMGMKGEKVVVEYTTGGPGFFYAKQGLFKPTSLQLDPEGQKEIDRHSAFVEKAREMPVVLGLALADAMFLSELLLKFVRAEREDWAAEILLDIADQEDVLTDEEYEEVKKCARGR